jgi:hypothetical protein
MNPGYRRAELGWLTAKLPLSPSRSAFKLAYRALRIEARYLEECSRLADEFALPDSIGLGGVEGWRLQSSLGDRIKDFCSPELHAAVLQVYRERYKSDLLIAGHAKAILAGRRHRLTWKSFGEIERLYGRTPDGQ